MQLGDCVIDFTKHTISLNGETNTQPSITVLSPNGGESFKQGDAMNIQWKTNIQGSHVVNIILQRTDETQTTNIAHNIVDNVSPETGTSKYTWIIPSNLSGSFKVRVSSPDSQGQDNIDNTLMDTSNSSFAISSVTPNLQTYSNSQYGFSMNYQSGVATKVPYTWSQSAISAVGTPIVTIPVVTGSFDSGQIDIGMSTDQSNVANFLTVPTETEVPFQNASNVSINSITFLHFSRYSPAAGQFRNTDSYHTIRNGACWSVDLSVDGEETNRLNATQVPLANADFTHIQSELNANLQTFRFLR